MKKFLALLALGSGWIFALALYLSSQRENVQDLLCLPPAGVTPVSLRQGGGAASLPAVRESAEIWLVTTLEDDTPVAGCSVRFRGGEGVTDTDGYAILPRGGAGEIYEINADGYRSQKWSRSNATPLHILLEERKLILTVMRAGDGVLPGPVAVKVNDLEVVLSSEGSAEIPLTKLAFPLAITADRPGYISRRITVPLSLDDPVVDLVIRPCTLSGRVFEAGTGQPVAGAKVTLLGVSVEADDGGGYLLEGIAGMEGMSLPGGETPVTVTAEGYRPEKVLSSLVDGSAMADFNLTRR